MKCNEIEIYAIPYLDGTLPAREREQVELHLRGCSACAERLRGFSEVSSLLDNWEGIQPSASFNARLQHRILAQPAASASWWERIWVRLIPLPLSKPVLAGAVLAVMLVAVAVVRYSPSPFGAAGTEQGTTPTVAVLSDGPDELALYRDLAVLEDWELLSNFEVLQELNTSTP